MGARCDGGGYFGEVERHPFGVAARQHQAGTLALSGADRTVDIQPNPLPTIAVLVNRKELGERIAEALDRELEARNLKAVNCTDGRIISEANEIGIFDVNDIKGLEFEAVFFLAIDRLSEQQDLYARFRYVVATRAATYLGITCEGDLPDALETLKAKFVDLR